MLRAIGLAALLGVSASTLAQGLLGPEPRPSPVAASNAGLTSTIAEWNALRASNGLPFSSYARFLIDHPGWPSENALRTNAERALRPGIDAPVLVASYFRRLPPQSATAQLRQAEALEAIGQRGEAHEAARKAWSRGTLSTDDEAVLLARFSGALSAADHDARMDRLLWNRSTTAAARQLALTSVARRPVFDARLAMLTRAPDAAVKASLTADAVRSDAGYVADRATWLRSTGSDYAARALLAAPRALTNRPADAENWLELLLSNARAAAAEGGWQTTYDIARQADDAYPPGTDIRERPLSERDDYTSLVWLGAWTAYEKLNRPADALVLFDRYARAARSPQTQSKGWYWAGRAADAAGRRADATHFLGNAAQHIDQFHGQLAAERLGQTIALPPATQPEVSPAIRASYFAQEVVRAAQYLGSTGDWPTQSLFVRQIAQVAKSESDHVLGYELAARLGRPDLAVMIGRSAGINGYRGLLARGFPTLPQAQGRADFTMIHAIARQESQFDRKIVSRAGARGTMQLMPGTAAETAGKIGIGYAASSLDDPAYNIQLGSWYFARLMDRYGGSYPLAVAAYNAGPGNVNRWLVRNGDPRLTGNILDWIEAIPLTETRGYVHRVLENAVIYDTIAGRPAGRAPLSTYLGKPTPG